MTWTAPEVERTDPPVVGDERTSLQSWLDFHRATLLFKCAGLTAEQLKQCSVPPSSLTLLGLVRHMAEVERWWFRTCFGGADLDDIYCTPDNPDGDFDDVQTADAEADFAIFNEECHLSNEATKGASLDDTFFQQRRGRDMDLRWVYLHMIEEYARHNGHADLLRERIDGVTGD
jgi:hypothetical protein